MSDQQQHNKGLIAMNWMLLLTHGIGGFVCLGLWLANIISDRQMLGLTLWLSFEAIVISSLGNLIISYTKRDVDTRRKPTK